MAETHPCWRCGWPLPLTTSLPLQPLPEKLRKSPKVLKRKDRPLTTTLVPRKFLPLFPECYQVKEECSLAQSHSPQVLRRETFAGEPPLSPGCVQDNKRRATLTPKVLMRWVGPVSGWAYRATSTSSLPRPLGPYCVCPRVASTSIKPSECTVVQSEGSGPSKGDRMPSSSHLPCLTQHVAAVGVT